RRSRAETDERSRPRRSEPEESAEPMMRLPRFRYHAPTTAAQAVRIKSEAGPESSYVAGGTDLYPNMKRRQQTPKVVVGLSRIPGLRRIRFGPAGVSIG